MTPGQFIDLLEKAGMLKEESPGVLGWYPTMQKAEAFASLVAAAEREECARVCEVQRNAVIALHPARIEFDPNDISPLKCAAAIRARGQHD